MSAERTTILSPANILWGGGGDRSRQRFTLKSGDRVSVTLIRGDPLELITSAFLHPPPPFPTHPPLSPPIALQWEAADAEIKVPSAEGQYIAIYILHLLPGISSLLISSLLVHSPACFSDHLPISYVLAVANTWFLCRPAE